MPSPKLKRGAVCPTCGMVHPRCHGHNRSGKPCRQNTQANQEVCHLHGGKSPQAIVHATAKALEAEARAVIAARWSTGSSSPVVDPLGTLALLAGEIVAWKDYLRDKVTDLDGALAYWVDRDFIGPDGEVARSEAAEQLRAIVVAYERGQDRAAKVLGDMVKLDIAGRMADIREQQAAAIVGAVRVGLAALDFLTVEQRGAALSAVADQLDQITPPDVHLPQEIYR